MSGPANLGRRRRGWISTPSVHSIDSTYTCVHSLTNYSCLIGMVHLSKFTRIASITTWFEVKNKSIINQAAAISFVKLFVVVVVVVVSSFYRCRPRSPDRISWMQ